MISHARLFLSACACLIVAVMLFVAAIRDRNMGSRYVYLDVLLCVLFLSVSLLNYVNLLG